MCMRARMCESVCEFFLRSEQALKVRALPLVPFICLYIYLETGSVFVALLALELAM